MFAFLIIPSKSSAGELLPHETLVKVRELALRVFIAECGGATLSEAQGVWKAPDNSVMHESVTRIEAWCGERDPSTWLRWLAEDIRMAASQESVMFGVVDGRAWFTT